MLLFGHVLPQVRGFPSEAYHTLINGNIAMRMVVVPESPLKMVNHWLDLEQFEGRVVSHWHCSCISKMQKFQHELKSISRKMLNKEGCGLAQMGRVPV
jgi:hypothetical protein